MATEMIDKVNGPAAAALLAGGIGSAAMGIITLIYELDDQSGFSKSMTWYKPVGGLSGKSSWAIIIFFVAWAILHFVWKDKDTNFARISSLAIALLFVGLIGTFPPVWHLLKGS